MPFHLGNPGRRYRGVTPTEALDLPHDTYGPGEQAGRTLEEKNREFPITKECAHGNHSACSGMVVNQWGPTECHCLHHLKKYDIEKD